ncbi:hypothetical protein OAH04_00815 [Crocinitomicaceae bacterium]|nr:hypothetical protein [Crocinitomicaceae bacterium]
MKKLNKINPKQIRRLENEIKNSGPSYRIFDNELSNEVNQSNANTIRKIDNFLNDIQFNESIIFDPPQYDDVISHDAVCDSEKWLGSYHPISSPGRITLYVNNLIGFTWYVTKELIKRDHYIDLEVFNQIVYNVVRKTIYHELFHHYCNFNRIFSDGRALYDFETEEALAVAFSRIYLGIENNQLPLYTDLFKIAYRYRGRGYKDWVLYQNESAFLDELIKYSSYQTKLSNLSGSNLYVISQSNLETVVNNPNIEYILK